MATGDLGHRQRPGIVAHSVVQWNPQQFAKYKCFTFSGTNIDTGLQQVDFREMLWICLRICHSFYMFHSFFILLNLLLMRWASILSRFQTCSCGGSNNPRAKLCWILSNQRFFASCLCDHARYQNEWCVTDTDSLRDPSKSSWWFLCNKDIWAWIWISSSLYYCMVWILL